jgi:hypothetical protein
MSFEIKTLSKVSLKNPILIEGLPGIGNVGKISLDFLVDSLNAKPFIEIYSDYFPNSVFVNEKNLIDVPRITLYHKKIKNKDFIFLTGDVQPVDEYGCYQFCHEVLKLFKKFKGNTIVTLGGIGLNKIPENPKIYITGNSVKILKEFNEKILNRKIFGTVGPIMGVTGLLVGLSTNYGINSVCLLSQTFSHPSYLGIRGAKVLLKYLDDRYKFKLDFKNLNKEIKEIESELSLKMVEQQNHVTKEGASEVSYIG